MTPLAMMSHAMTSTTLHELTIGAARATMPQKMSNNASGMDGLDVFLVFSTILPPLLHGRKAIRRAWLPDFPNWLAAQSADISRAIRHCHPRHRSVHPPYVALAGLQIRPV